MKTIIISGVAVLCLGLGIVLSQSKVNKTATVTPTPTPTALVTGTPTLTPPSPTASSSTNGTLKGKLLLSPICPVEQPGVICSPSPGQYQDHQISLYQGTTLVKAFISQGDGTFQLSLAPGTYRAEVKKIGAETSDISPSTFTIRAGQTSTLNINVDTGIR